MGCVLEVDLSGNSERVDDISIAVLSEITSFIFYTLSSPHRDVARGLTIAGRPAALPGLSHVFFESVGSQSNNVLFMVEGRLEAQRHQLFNVGLQDE